MREAVGEVGGPGDRQPSSGTSASASDGLAGSAEEPGRPSAALSVYDLQSAPRDKHLRQLPRVLWRCLALVWRASPRACLASAVLQVATGVGVGVELLAAKRLLSASLEAERAAAGLGRVVPALALLVITATLLSFVSAIQGEQQRILAEVVRRHVQDQLLDVAVAVDLEAFESPTFLDRLQRAQLAGETRPWQMTHGLVTLLGGAVAVVGIGVALLVIQPLLLPLTLAASVPLWLVMLRNSREAHAFSYEMTAGDRERRYLGDVLMAKGLAKEVRLFGLASLLRRRYDALYDQRITALRQLVRTRLRRSLAATAITGVLTAVALVVLASLLLSGRIELAGAATAALGVQQLAVRLRATYAGAGSIYEGALFLEDFESFLQMGPAVEEARPRAPARMGFSTLTLDNVSFSYPGTGRWALKDVSITINAGEVVALVGENGSGKTTLAKLLCHLYAPTTGRILWDGDDTAACDPADLRRHVTAIFQDFGTYEMSARENIAVGRPERLADLDGVVAAAKQAGAHGFLSRLPAGYETRLGRQFRGGRELSIGQWQRVALGRAFFRDACLLVLDEPTAALDARAEHELFESVKRLARGKTLLLISHRFSSVRAADRIFVLDGGRLIEQGTHDELLASGGRYAELFALQASSYVDGKATVQWDAP